LPLLRPQPLKLSALLSQQQSPLLSQPVANYSLDLQPDLIYNLLCKSNWALIMNKLQTDFKNKFQGSTALKPRRVYTGTEMVGIAQMHKSNAQPVFNKQAAVDAAQMRR